jgi:hypothetical protein
MFESLDLQFLLFYCLVVKKIPAPFYFLVLVFYCLFPLCFDL